jgi:hypothetical protein
MTLKYLIDENVNPLLVFLINLRIPTQLSSDLPIENLGEDIFKGSQ